MIYWRDKGEILLSRLACLLVQLCPLVLASPLSGSDFVPTFSTLNRLGRNQNVSNTNTTKVYGLLARVIK